MSHSLPHKNFYFSFSFVIVTKLVTPDDADRGFVVKVELEDTDEAPRNPAVFQSLP